MKRPWPDPHGGYRKPRATPEEIKARERIERAEEARWRRDTRETYPKSKRAKNRNIPAMSQMKKARIGRPPVYKTRPVKKNLALPKALNARIERHVANLNEKFNPRETFTSFAQRALEALLTKELG